MTVKELFEDIKVKNFELYKNNFNCENLIEDEVRKYNDYYVVDFEGINDDVLLIAIKA